MVVFTLLRGESSPFLRHSWPPSTLLLSVLLCTTGCLAIIGLVFLSPWLFYSISLARVFLLILAHWSCAKFYVMLSLHQSITLLATRLLSLASWWAKMVVLFMRKNNVRRVLGRCLLARKFSKGSIFKTFKEAYLSWFGVCVICRRGDLVKGLFVRRGDLVKGRPLGVTRRRRRRLRGRRSLV